MEIDRITVGVDEEGMYWINYYADDIRYGISIIDIHKMQCEHNDTQGEGEFLFCNICESYIDAQHSVQSTVLCAGHSEGSFIKDGVCQTCGLHAPHSG